MGRHGETKNLSVPSDGQSQSGGNGIIKSSLPVFQRVFFPRPALSPQSNADPFVPKTG